MNLLFAELRKVWGNRVFPLLLAVLAAANLLLLWMGTRPTANQPPAAAYKAVSAEMSGMSMEEKGAFLHDKFTEYESLLRIANYYRELAYGGGTYLQSYREENAALFDEYEQEYQGESYNLYTSNLTLEYQLFNQLCSEYDTVAGYGEFLDSVQTKATQLAGISIFQKDSTGYDLKNIEVTARVYAGLNDTLIDYAPQKGLYTALSYAFTDLILLAAMLLLALLLVRQERDSGLLALVRSLPGGRLQTALAKLGAFALSLLAVQKKVAAGELNADALLAYSALQQKYSVYQKIINQNINAYLGQHPKAWLVYESGYRELFGFSGTADVQDTLYAGLLCALCFSGLFAMERKGGMEEILCTTPLGRRRTVRAKLAVSAGAAVLIAAATCLPHLIQVLRDYGLPALFAPAISISEFAGLPSVFTLSDVLLFWFLCRAAACLCMGCITLWLGQRFGSLLPTLFVSAVGYCLPALLSLSGMAGGIEWLGFWPLFHAAALLGSQGAAPCSYGWVAVILLGAATVIFLGLMAELDCRYEWKGLVAEK